MKSKHMFLNARLLIAGVILIGGILLLLPQNGVMAWIESGSMDTFTDDMTSANTIVSDRLILSIEKINHSMVYSSEQFAMIMNNAGEHVQTVFDTINAMTPFCGSKSNIPPIRITPAINSLAFRNICLLFILHYLR